MKSVPHIGIVGGGLAGACAAIHLRILGFEVTVIEKDTFPRHKVCGEYISKEVLPYLTFLGIDLPSLTQINLNRFQLTAPRANVLNCVLPLGGVGLSRFTLDFALYQRANHLGVHWINTEVTEILKHTSHFEVQTKADRTYTFDYVCCAHGKRSILDLKLNRNFIAKKAPWIGVKFHVSAEFPDDLVALHHFYGGYCGLSKVESNQVNVCYLATYESFKRHKNTELFEKEEMYKNIHLKRFLENAIPWNQAPLSISQISFEDKTCVENQMLMLGDAAGLIHPLCGNGIAMAMHSAALAVDAIQLYFKRQITLTEMNKRYVKSWKEAFSGRLTWGKTLGKWLIHPHVAPSGIRMLARIPFVLPKIIKQTHGKPFDFYNPNHNSAAYESLHSSHKIV